MRGKDFPSKPYGRQYTGETTRCVGDNSPESQLLKQTGGGCERPVWMVSVGESCHRLWWGCQHCPEYCLLISTSWVKTMCLMNLALQGFGQAPSQPGKAVFACIPTCLDLAGFFVSSCPSEALEPCRVRHGQWRANRERKEPSESASSPNTGVCIWGVLSSLLDTPSVLCKPPWTENEAQSHVCGT